jgi:hypothetical protein
MPLPQPRFIDDDWQEPEIYEELSWDLCGLRKRIRRVKSQRPISGRNRGRLAR